MMSGMAPETELVLAAGEVPGYLGPTAALVVAAAVIGYLTARARVVPIVGFLVGTTLGSVTGLLLWLSKTAALVLRPVIVAINGVPKIALAPLIRLTSLGIRSVNQSVVEAARAFGATPAQIMFKVELPMATPNCWRVFR